MKPRRLKLDVVVATVGQLLEKLAGFAVLMVLTRYLPAAQLGDYFFAISVAGLCGILTALGTTQQLNRSIAQAPARTAEHLGQVLSVRVPLTLSAYALINLATALVSPGLLLVVSLASAYTLLGYFWFTYSAVLLGQHRVKTRTVIALLGPGMQAALVPAAAAMGWSFEMILLILAGSNALMVMVTAVWVHRRWGPVAMRWPDRAAWMFALASWPFLAMTALRAANFRLDTVMVYTLASPAAAATYETAFKLMEVSQLPIRPLVLVFFPLCSAMAAQAAWRPLWRTTTKLVTLALVGGVGVGVGGAVVAPWVMPAVWGPTYAEAGDVMRVLYLTIPALWLGGVLTFLAAAVGREKQAAIAQCLCLGLNLGMNALIVPSWGAVGAAWTTLVSQCGLSVSLALRVRAVLAERLRKQADGADVALAAGAAYGTLADHAKEQVGR